MGNPTAIISENTGYVRLEWSMRCPKEIGLSIRFDAFFPKDASHTHIARMSINKTPLVEKLFTTRNRNWVVRSVEQKNGKGEPTGPAVAVLFGFVHGSGFAGSLLKIGLPADRFLPALFGFNLGVESGQLGIVAAFWALAQISLRIVPLLQSYSWQRTLNNLTSAVLCGLGIFWFISRAYV